MTILFSWVTKLCLVFGFCMAWLIFIFSVHICSPGYPNFIMPGSIFFPPCTQENYRKPFSRSWNRTRLASSASEHSIHFTSASRAPKKLVDNQAQHLLARDTIWRSLARWGRTWRDLARFNFDFHLAGVAPVRF